MSAIPAGYKQTEVGVIPEEWAVSTMSKSMRLINGCAFKPHEWRKEGIPIVRIQNLNDAAADFNYFQGQIDERNRVVEGDVLFAWSGTLGSSFGARLWTGPDGVLNQHIFKVIADERVFTKHYSYLIFKRVQEDIEKKSHGFKSSFVHVKKADIDNILLPIPPLSEQRAIATALSDVDALIAKLDQLIAKKRDLKQAAMQQLLTGQTRLPGFSGKWEVKRLRDLLTYEQPTKYLVKTSEYNNENDTPVLTAGKTFILGYTHETNGIFDRLPVIIFDDFTTATKYVTFPFKAKSSAMKILKPRDESVNLRLVFEMMQLIKFQLGDHKRYWISEYQKLEIKTPKPDEQFAICTVISDMDSELAALESRRDKTRALKQGMMQELLTGRIRLV